MSDLHDFQVVMVGRADEATWWRIMGELDTLAQNERETFTQFSTTITPKVATASLRYKTDAEEAEEAEERDREAANATYDAQLEVDDAADPEPDA